MNKIKKGHGLTDVSCPHGSRFIWWFDKECTPPLGEWEAVVLCSNCNCGMPPLPFRNKAQMQAYLDEKQTRLETKHLVGTYTSGV